jgi:hypothetical protein
VPSKSQRLDQHLLGRHVEMVGRLVEHQEVRRVEEHQRHDEARLLAARQHAARLFSTSSPEKPKQPASVRSVPCVGLREGASSVSNTVFSPSSSPSRAGRSSPSSRWRRW